MKYVIAVGDGMADEQIAELGGLSPLEYAKTPALDEVAKRGICGMVNLIPEGFPPGSDIGNMSLMGYDPQKYHTGRAPIEAASIGIKLAPNEVAFRCNLVTIKDGIMNDYSAGHIQTDSASEIIKALKTLDCDRYTFHLGVQYRHILVVRDIDVKGATHTPPHDISDQEVANYLPKNELLLDIMEKAHAVLKNCDENKKRLSNGQKPVTDIWLWGEGGASNFPSLKEKYGLTGGVASAVDLVKGIGVLAGLKAPTIVGATGYLGTNYAGKLAKVKEFLKDGDFALIHIEAPDETSHEGDLKKKLQAIEEYDQNVVAKLIEMADEMGDLTVMILPDHPTYVRTKTHALDLVPFAVFGPKVPKGNSTVYSENSAKASGIVVNSGEELFDKFIKGGFVG